MADDVSYSALLFQVILAENFDGYTAHTECGTQHLKGKVLLSCTPQDVRVMMDCTGNS